MDQLVFFDTEFTTLSVGGFRALISIGLVTEDGREFYAEISDSWSKGMCSKFVIDTVLPLLEGDEFLMSKAEVAANLLKWIESLGENDVVLCSDAPEFDWPWVEDMFNFHGIWPRNLHKKCRMLYFRQKEKIERYDVGLKKYWLEHSEKRHHALVDARSLLFAWQSANRSPYI